MRRILVALYSCSAISCTESPQISVPSPVTPAPIPRSAPIDPAGVWRGLEKIIKCDYPSCGFIANLPPFSGLITVTLGPYQAGLTGSVDFSFPYGMSIPVTATLNADRSLIVDGGMTWKYACFNLGPPTSTGVFVINEWHAVFNSAATPIRLGGATMLASFSYTFTKNLSSCYFADVTATAEAVLTRVTQ